MNPLDLMAHAIVLLGLFFFLAGTVGLLRFPDLFARLHALAKADNLGLGLVILGASVADPDLRSTLKLILIWVLTLFSSATACYMIANTARRAMRGTEEDAVS